MVSATTTPLTTSPSPVEPQSPKKRKRDDPWAKENALRLAQVWRPEPLDTRYGKPRFIPSLSLVRRLDGLRGQMADALLRCRRQRPTDIVRETHDETPKIDLLKPSTCLDIDLSPKYTLPISSDQHVPRIQLRGRSRKTQEMSYLSTSRGRQLTDRAVSYLRAGDVSGLYSGMYPL